MGRNGKNAPIFLALITAVNENVGKTVGFNALCPNIRPGRNAATSYIYKFIKLGYTELVCGTGVTDAAAKYKILKPFPAHYTSVTMACDLHLLKVPKDY